MTNTKMTKGREFDFMNRDDSKPKSSQKKLFFASLFPTREIKIITVFSILLISGLIFAPPIFRLANYFDPANYYSLVGGIIAGIITLLALLIQFSHENEKRHEEIRINARGIFEVRYTTSIEENDRLKKCQVQSNSTQDNVVSKYLVAKLHGEKSIMDCNIKFDAVNKSLKKESYCIFIGLVVPNQIIVIPVPFEEQKIDVRILYRTLMEEIIIHEFEFENENCGIRSTETMLSKQSKEMIFGQELDKILDCNNFNIIYESRSRLFEYLE